MSIVAFDTETHLIRPGKQIPEMVCLTWQRPLEEPHILHARDPEAHRHVEGWLREATMVGHNVAYDMAVVCVKWPDLMPLVFQAYDDDRVTDTMLRQQLLDIAANCHRGEFGDDGRWRKHNYSLDDLVHRVRGSRLKKDGWRLMYSYFSDTPIERWPKRAAEVREVAIDWLAGAYKCEDGKMGGPWPEPLEYKDVKAIVDEVDPMGVVQYPLEDARATLEVFLNQEPHAAEYLKDQYRQARAYFAFQLWSAYGLKTTARGVAEFEAMTREEYDEVKDELLSAGLVRADGSRNIKAAQTAMVAACTRLGQEVRLTEGGAPTLEKDACEAVDDPVIKQYSQFLTLGKVLNNDVAALKKGVDLPIHPRYGLADTGRSTCTGTINIQGVRRKKGIRELFVPRPGHVFFQGDYEGLELHTFGQACMTLFGHSKMADALKAGLDPHLIMGARILNIGYDQARERLDKVKDGAKDDEIKEARQVSKPCNFGFIDGLGARTLVEYARKVYGVTLTEEKAKYLKQEWLQQWDAQDYFNYVRDLCTYEGKNGKPLGYMEQLFVGRFKYGTFTGLCSALHQGLGADCAKNASWLVSKAQYTQPTSALYGTHGVAFIHDEIIGECRDDDRAHDVAQELGRLMLKGANKYLPDCPARVEPLLMDCWSKAAVPLYDDRKRLRVWRLKEHEK